jgi:hypothetical protein
MMMVPMMSSDSKMAVKSSVTVVGSSGISNSSSSGSGSGYGVGAGGVGAGGVIPTY